ncbi:hypothetical protein [Streptacidiphilus sp. EB103A]|uniref:hypothetical protein n=1 Tax=Streptacidiphilus sp. EB103A TaxID=3156275 RepID=UPI0035196D57
MSQIPYTVKDSDGFVQHGVFQPDFPGVEYFEGEGSGEDNPVYGVNDLYRTESGFWIWGTSNTGTDALFAYEGITEEQARDWLEKNGHHEAVDRYFNKPKGGRPAKGEKFQARVPRATLERIDADAARNEMDRSDLVAALIEIAYCPSVAERRMLETALGI